MLIYTSYFAQVKNLPSDIVPISKGGTNDLVNIVALCQTCNTIKDGLLVIIFVK